MSPKATRSATAVRDLEQIVDFLKRESSAVALRFLAATEESFEFLSRNRNAGQRCQFIRPDMTEVRIWPVHGFRNHLIFFRPIDDGVEIIRVLHGARDLESLFDS